MAKASRRFKEAKARRERGGFVALPFVVIRSVSWSRLSPHAVKLLCDLLAQYKGDNNGDLTLAWGLMAQRGWVSKATLYKARAELMERGWIILTRQGGRHQPSLYGVTFYAIDNCNGKLEVSSTGSPSSDWRKDEPVQPLKPLKSGAPPDGPIAKRLAHYVGHQN